MLVRCSRVPSVDLGYNICVYQLPVSGISCPIALQNIFDMFRVCRLRSTYTESHIISPLSQSQRAEAIIGK